MKIFYVFHLPKLNQEDINNLNRSVTSNEIKAVIKSLPGRRGIKENDGEGNSSMIYLIYYNNFCKCHNVLPAQHFF
jgi:hypothetical protein